MKQDFFYCRLHRIKLLILFLTTIGVFVSTSGLSGLSGLSKELKVPPIYHDQAIDIAMKATVFGAIPNTVISARREMLAYDNTPLIRERIVGRPIWRVTIQNVNLNNLKPPSGKETNPNVSGFDVIVDAETGQMLKVVSLWNAKTHPKEEIRALISDQELDEKFRGNPPRFPSELPESLPEIPFLQVLETLGGGTHATHIEAIYVGNTQKRKWIIIQHGAPVSVMFNDIGKDFRRVRYDFVDAKTGEHSLGGGREGPPDYDKFMLEIPVELGNRESEEKLGRSQRWVKSGADSDKFTAFHTRIAGEKFDRTGKEIKLPEDTKELFPINGDFESSLRGWIKWFGPDRMNSQRTVEVVYDQEKGSHVVEFKRMGGRTDGSLVGIAQDVYIDLSQYDELYLQLDVKCIYQSLTGGGWAGGSEYPVCIELAFVDQNGTSHRWQHGFYFNGQDKYPTSTKVTKDRWYTYTSPNLKEMIPLCGCEKNVGDLKNWFGAETHPYDPTLKPKAITRVILFGGGWDFISRADNLRFTRSRR